MTMATKQDPTGQAKNRRAAYRSLTKRLIQARRRVVDAFKAIPRTRSHIPDLTLNANFFDYDVNPELITGMQGSIAFIVNSELLDSATIVAPATAPIGWYYQKQLELPFRQGSITAVNQLNRILDKTTVKQTLLIDAISVQNVLSSPGYTQALNVTYATSWEQIKSLSNTTATQVMGEITRGMEAGLSPTEISKNITARFKVADSSAKRIAFTEVNKAYNDAIMRTGDIAAKSVGLNAAVVHESALLPTTRLNHARRHGNVYLVTAQLRWWNTGANRINCHCSVRIVLVDDDGKIIQ